MNQYPIRDGSRQCPESGQKACHRAWELQGHSIGDLPMLQ